MKRQRKFNAQLDLEVEIIKQRRQAVKELKLANSHKAEMKRWFDLANNPSDEITPGAREHYRSKGFDERRLMDRNLRLLKRIEIDMIPRLSRAMGELKTQVFEFSKDDTSVVLK